MLCLSHFTGKGASVSDVGAAATAQMGGPPFSCSELLFSLRGRGTEGADILVVVDGGWTTLEMLGAGRMEAESRSGKDAPTL